MEKNKSLQNNPVPVILGGYINGLGIARSFGRAGIQTIVLDNKKNIAFSSKYVQGIICPDPVHETPKFLDFLSSLGKSLKSKAYLISTTDDYLIPISKNRDILEKDFTFSMSDWNTIKLCIDKTNLYKFCEKLNVSHPKTTYIDGTESIEEIRKKISYPSIYKPSITVGFLGKMGNSKAIILKNQDDLNALIDKISELKIKGICQEYIPGGIEELYTCTSYANINHEIIAYSVGHKIRQNPPNGGTITCGLVVHNEEVLDASRKLINAVKFHGISNIEYKRNVLTNEFTLIEINPRPGMWNSSSFACEVNLNLIGYLDILSKDHSNLKKVNNSKKIIWLDTITDLYNSIYRFKHSGYYNYHLSFRKWLKSIKGKKVDAVFSIYDFKPFIVHLVLFFKRKWKDYRKLKNEKYNF